MSPSIAPSPSLPPDEDDYDDLEAIHVLKKQVDPAAIALANLTYRLGKRRGVRGFRDRIARGEAHLTGSKKGGDRRKDDLTSAAAQRRQKLAGELVHVEAHGTSRRAKALAILRRRGVRYPDDRAIRTVAQQIKRLEETRHTK